MNQFDVYKLSYGDVAVIIQNDMFMEFRTRVVVPLIPRSRGKLGTSLNPVLRYGRRDWVLATQLMSVVSVTAIKERLGSLANEDYAIKRAVDQLFQGV